MPERLRVAIIGCAPPGAETGLDRAYAHARGYLQTGECEIVALADWRPEAARVLAARIGGAVEVYDDYQELLDAERPDLVSLCTGPRHQPGMVLDAASADVRAIHGELPLASTWGEAKAMRKAAGQKGIQLTFNLAQRTLPAVRLARDLIAQGAIGEVVAAEATCAELLHQGTEIFGQVAFILGDAPAEWAWGEVSRISDRHVFGVPVEDRCRAEVAFRSHGRVVLTLNTGAELPRTVRLTGKAGELELGGRPLCLRYHQRDEAAWQEPGLSGAHDLESATAHGIADLVRCLEEGGEPVLAVHHAFRATELVFAVYEAHRSGRRVELPLHSEDSALLSMLAAGAL